MSMEEYEQVLEEERKFLVVVKCGEREVELDKVVDYVQLLLLKKGERKEDGGRKERVKKFTWMDSAKVLQRYYCLAAERGRRTLVQRANTGSKTSYLSHLIRMQLNNPPCVRLEGLRVAARDSAKVLQRHYCLAAERGRGTLVQRANTGSKASYFSHLIRMQLNNPPCVRLEGLRVAARDDFSYADGWWC